MHWILIIYFATGVQAQRAYDTEVECEIARDQITKRLDIAYWLNHEHPSAKVAYSACVRDRE